MPLFKGYHFYVLGNLDSSGATINDWMVSRHGYCGKNEVFFFLPSPNILFVSQNLLKKLGARVITSEDQVRKNVIIVGDSLDRTEDYQGMIHCTSGFIHEKSIKVHFRIFRLV